MHVNTFRFSASQVSVSEGLNVLPVHSRQRVPRTVHHDTQLCSSFALVHVWAEFHDQHLIICYVKEAVEFQSSSQWAGSTSHTHKNAPVIQLILIGSFLSSSEERPRLEHHRNRTNCFVNSPEQRHMDAVLWET